MSKEIIRKLVNDAICIVPSDSNIRESLEKQQKLEQKYDEKPLLFFRKYVGKGGKISYADFARVSFISDSTVKRYGSSSKRLVSISRKRVAYGLMYFWKALERKVYQDFKNSMEYKREHGEIERVPPEEDMRRMAMESLWQEYHAAFHEDAEMARELAEDPNVLVNILYNDRFKKVSLKGAKCNGRIGAKCNGLKAQKHLAQGNALGKYGGIDTPCKGKSILH